MKETVLIIGLTFLISGCAMNQKGSDEILRKEISEEQSIVAETGDYEGIETRSELLEQQEIIEIDEEQIIKEHAFITPLNSFGNLMFTPYKPENKNSDVIFYILDQEGNISYIFPYYYDDNNLQKEEIRFVNIEQEMFDDINGDGYKDVILILDYEDSDFSEIQSVRIFLGNDNGFTISNEFIDDVMNHFTDCKLEINVISDYLHAKNE